MLSGKSVVSYYVIVYLPTIFVVLSFICQISYGIKKSLNKNKNPGAMLEKIEEYKYTFSVF